MEFFSRINQDLFLQIFHFARQNSLLDFMMIFGAEYLIFIVFVICLFLTLKGFSADKKSLLSLTISLTVGLILIRIIDSLFYEPRPFISYGIIPLVYQPQDSSFPSLHTTVLTILALSFFDTKTKFKQVLIMPIAWTGFARVYTGVHYPLDIVGGVFVGIFSAIFATKIISRFFR